MSLSPYPDSVSFEDAMAAQLRRAPWLAISLVLHGIAVLILALIPADPPPEPEVAMAIQPPDTPPDIEDPPPEEPEIIPEVVDPELVPVDDPVLTPVENPSDVPAEVDAPFDLPSTDFTDLNTAAIGFGAGNPGGGGSKYGQRGERGGTPNRPLIEAALRWLAAHQDDDGRWDADGFMKHDLASGGAPCTGAGNPTHDVGVTGLALLAFLADGHTASRRGPYQEVVREATIWLLEQQDPDSGLIGMATSNEFLYDHAIATLALVEACGLSGSRLLRPKVQSALNYLEYHRNPYAAWRYQPRDGASDTSVTGWCILAYKSAQDFDFEVDPKSLETAAAWMDTMTDATTARTGYDTRGSLSSRHTGDHAARFPREKGECMTAVSLLCRVFLGSAKSDDGLTRRQADLVATKPPVWDTADGSIDHYAWYYGTYALYQIQGPLWRGWSKALGKALINNQKKDGNEKGSWDPDGVWGEIGGRVYSTAILCLTLQAYHRYTRVLVR